MIDIHCHFLPEIDDGAKTLEQALAMAQAAVDNGIIFSVVTPHINPGRYDNSLTKIYPRAKSFRAALKAAQIPLRIGMAAEVRLSPDILPLLDEGEIPFYGELDGFNIMLLEFPHTHIPPGADKLIDKLLDRKIRPIIAHPERNKDVIRSLNKIVPFVEMGCHLQLTASALAGRFGEGPHQRAREILQFDAFKVLATDAHNLKARTPELELGKLAAAEIIGAEAADDLVYANPLTIVRSQMEGSEAFWASAEARSSAKQIPVETADKKQARLRRLRAHDWRRRTATINDPKVAPATDSSKSGVATNVAKLSGMKAVFTISIDGKKLFKKKVDLSKGKIIIGRHPDSDIVIHGDFISRRHAVLTVAGDMLKISDLNSKNGMRVNGKKVATSKLQDGDRLTLGACDIVFSLEPSNSPQREVLSANR